jgi:hypothetical protein
MMMPPNQASYYVPYQVTYYVAYFGCCFTLIFWLARILHRAGGIFLDDAFHGKPTLTKAVTQLLDVGYYMMSFGWVAVSFDSEEMSRSYLFVSKIVLREVGGFLLLMGFVHLFNMLLLALFRRKTVAPAAPATA